MVAGFGKMKINKLNQNGSILVTALMITLLFTISSLYIFKQAEQLEKQSQLPKFLNAFKSMENRLINKLSGINWSACSPSITALSASSDIQSCLLSNNINEVNWIAPLYGQFTVDYSSVSIDVDNYLTIDIRYNPASPNSIQKALTNFRDRKRVKISTNLANSSPSALCAPGQVLSGFNTDGTINCKWIQGTGITSYSCPPAMYMKGILGDGKPDCVSLNQIISCPSGQVITQLRWRGGTPIYSCSSKANPTSLFGSWRPIRGL